MSFKHPNNKLQDFFDSFKETSDTEDSKPQVCCICSKELDDTQQETMVVTVKGKPPYEEGICDSCADKWNKGII